MLGLGTSTASALETGFALPNPPQDEQIYRGLGDTLRLELAYAVRALLAPDMVLDEVLRKVLSGTTQRVAFFGDSITAPGHRSTVMSFSELIRYVSWLNPYEGIEVANFGIAGNTSRDALARLEDVFEFRPQIAVILFGTNDHCFLLGGDGNLFPIVSISEYRQNINTLVDQFLRVSTVPLLCTIPPLKTAPGQWAVDWQYAVWPRDANADYANVVREVASRRSLPWLDVNELLKIYDVGVTIFEDGIHVTTEGHIAMARGILRTLAAMKR